VTTRIKNALGRIVGYAIVAFMVYFVGVVIVLETKSLYREIDAQRGDYKSWRAEQLIRHVDATLYLCQNLDFIPYPLSYYITEEGREITNLAPALTQ